MRDRDPGSDTLRAGDRRSVVAGGRRKVVISVGGVGLARSTVRVRGATEEDLPALLRLAAELRDASNLRHHVRLPVNPDAGLRARYAALLADPDRRILVAVDAGSAEVLGMMVLAPDVLSALLEHRVAFVSHLLVASRHRRCGAGRALVAAAVSYADEFGLDQVVVGVSPHSRDANRFYARLGFAPMVIQRLAAVPLLRRSLGLPEPVADVRIGPAAGRRARAVGRLRRARSPLRPREHRDAI
jgi:ribosomal protein S18 acetylase RimI-like enzyme